VKSEDTNIDYLLPSTGRFNMLRRCLKAKLLFISALYVAYTVHKNKYDEDHPVFVTGRSLGSYYKDGYLSYYEDGYLRWSSTVGSEQEYP